LLSRNGCKGSAACEEAATFALLAPSFKNYSIASIAGCIVSDVSREIRADGIDSTSLWNSSSDIAVRSRSIQACSPSEGSTTLQEEGAFLLRRLDSLHTLPARMSSSSCIS